MSDPRHVKLYEEMVRLKGELDTAKRIARERQGDIIDLTKRLDEALARVQELEVECRDRADSEQSLMKWVDEYGKALEEIQEGKGTYSLDPLTHASNTIRDMVAIATEAIEGVKDE